MKVKVKIPKEIKIGVHPYKVMFKAHLIVDEAVLGDSNRRTQELRIDSTLPASERAVTFYHECLESGNRIYHFSVDDDTIDRIAHLMAEIHLNNLGIEFDWSEIE